MAADAPLLIVFCIDKSGSMGDIEKNPNFTTQLIVDEYNNFVSKAKKMGKRVYMLSKPILFNEHTTLTDIMKMKPRHIFWTRKQKPYTAEGGTPLYSVICDTIRSVNAHRRKKPRKGFAQADVLYVIISDGKDNGDVSVNRVQDTIEMELLNNENGKRFILYYGDCSLGTDEIARSMGIPSLFANGFMMDKKGISYLFDSVFDAVNVLRKKRNLAEANSAQRKIEFGKKINVIDGKLTVLREQIASHSFTVQEFLSDYDDILARLGAAQKDRVSINNDGGSFGEDLVTKLNKSEDDFNSAVNSFWCSHMDNYFADNKDNLNRLDKLVIEYENEIKSGLNSLSLVTNIANAISKCKNGFDNYELAQSEVRKYGFGVIANEYEGRLSGQKNWEEMLIQRFEQCNKS